MRIYLDNAATTKPTTSGAFQKHIDSYWQNPSAAYASAEAVYIAMKQTRQLLADMIMPGSGVIFTSGGTEANNTAILSSFKKGAHFITSAVEHPSVYETFKHIEGQGAKVDYVLPRGHCVIAEDVAALVREDTAMVSVMHVNNETGAINEIGAIADAVKSKNPKTRVHSDGVQALFKTLIDLPESVDYYTVSAHKIGAFKGVGALLAGRNKTINKLHFGGEQEHSLRPGTENTLGIQSFDEALRSGQENFDAELQTITALSTRLTDGLERIHGAVRNVPAVSVPHIVNVSFEGVRAEVLVRALGEKGIYIGTGAACSKGKISRVLLESGVARGLAEGAVRISMNALNTNEEIDICLTQIEKTVRDLRRFGRH